MTPELLQAMGTVIGILILLTVMAYVADRKPAEDDEAVVYESRKGRILGPGSGITTAEEARRVCEILSRKEADR